MSPRLSLLIPAYNEQRRLADTLTQVQRYFSTFYPRSHEILVVDDGSTDRTVEVARSLLPVENVIRLHKNLGKGAAVRAGLMAAKGQRILWMDADLSTPLAEERKLRDVLDKGFDIALGSRAGQGKNEIAWTRKGLQENAKRNAGPSADAVWNVQAHRYYSGRTFAWVTKTLLDLSILDTQCGFKMITRECAAKIAPLCKVNRFAFDVEFLYRAKQLGMSMREVPVRWTDRPGSKVRVAVDGLEMLAQVASLKWRPTNSET